MQDMWVEVIYLIASTLIATISNILYRSRKKLKIKPLVLRVMHGVLSVSIFVIIVMLTTGNYPDYSITSVMIVYFIGYYTEILIDLFEDKIPHIFDSWLKKILNIDIKGGVKDEKSNEKNKKEAAKNDKQTTDKN